jgi:hypothetical protein
MDNLAFMGSKGEKSAMYLQVILGAIVCPTFIIIAIYTRKTLAPLL